MNQIHSTQQEKSGPLKQKQCKAAAHRWSNPDQPR